jgi:hypothetical protein
VISWYVAHVFSKSFEMVPVAPIITGITLVFTFHMCCISIVRSLYFRIFSAIIIIIIIIINIIIIIIITTDGGGDQVVTAWLVSPGNHKEAINLTPMADFVVP